MRDSSSVQPGGLGGSVSSLSPGNAWEGVERPAGRPLSHTLQCVVLTGIPILEANTTVTAEASSIVNPLWKEGKGEEGKGGGSKETFFIVMSWMMLMMARSHWHPHIKPLQSIQQFFKVYPTHIWKTEIILNIWHTHQCVTHNGHSFSMWYTNRPLCWCVSVLPCAY